MSNGGSWQPPQPESTGPPVPAQPLPPPPGPRATPLEPPATPLEPTATPPTRSRGKIVAAIVGVVVLLAAGVFAITRLAGGGESAGGADTPEAAGLALLTALENEDMLGAIDVLLPGERNALREPATDLAAEFQRLEVLTDGASLSDIGGVDIVLDDESVTTEDTNVDDIVGLRLRGSASATVEGDALPIGDAVLDNTDAEPSELDVDQTDAEEFDVPMVAVEEDGRWFVSLFHTAADALRQQATDEEIPATGVMPAGGDSPEDAVDAFIAGIETLDLEAIIASLNPDEFQALQRYAPLFLESAQADLDDVDLQLAIDEPAYVVSGEGDTRSISVSYLKGSITVDGERAGAEFEDGCLTMTPPEGEGEPIDTCQLTQDESSLDELFGEDSEQVQELADDLSAAFGDYENPGLIVKEVEGSWYVSPMATMFEQMLAVTRALDRQEIEDLADASSELFDELVSGVPGAPTFPDEFLEDDAVADTIPTDTVPTDTAPEDTLPMDTTPTDTQITEPTESNAAAECYAAETATDAADCFDALIATGEISPSEAPVYLRGIECGLGELFWSGDLYALPDAEFIATVEPAAPCFQALVAAGTLSEVDLPLELSHPECLEGKNWYVASDDEAYFDRLLECAYG